MKILRWSLPHSGWVIAGAAALVVLAGALIPFMGREFLPPFNEGTATISMLAQPGTSLEESNHLGQVAERQLLTIPEIKSVGRRTGRAELDEHAQGVHFSEIDVDFRPSKRKREALFADVREKLGMIPGVFVDVGQPISHRLDHILSGVRAQIAIKLFGSDLTVLRAKAEEIRAAVAAVPGTVDVSVEQQVLIPQILVRINREQAARLGIPSGTLADLAETALNGKVVGEILDGQRSFELFLRHQESEIRTIEALRATLIDTPGGEKVPLSSLAEIIESRGPNQIDRENVQRRIVIQANTTGRDLGGIVKEIQAAIDRGVKLPSTDYFIHYGGQFESQQSASRLIAILSLFSLAGMFLVLYSHFRSIRIVLQILINIPLAMIGSVAAIWLTGGVLSVASLVGFITLTGIASRNTIMMISHYIHLARHEGEVFGEALIIRGSLERLVPVLMTALTAGLSLIPLVLAKGQPGKEILYPVATVILGGLISSTLLDMVVTPAVFHRYGGKALADTLRLDAEDESLKLSGEATAAAVRS